MAGMYPGCVSGQTILFRSGGQRRSGACVIGRAMHAVPRKPSVPEPLHTVRVYFMVMINLTYVILAPKNTLVR